MNDTIPISTRTLNDYALFHGDLFKVYRRSNTEKLHQYLSGLFHEGKHNIERMNERIESSTYQQLHHFISESPWDHKAVIRRVSTEISDLYSSRSEKVGLIFDESGHRKNGKHSVGVARQYLGSIGKTDNGQVGVFCGLTQSDEVALIDSRLYLPQSWTEDSHRCDKAGIPKEDQVYKTKPELALEMVESMESSVNYDWIGGDSLYGNSTELRKALQKLGKLFVMDVGDHLQVYLEDPKPYLPVCKTNKGRPKSRYISDSKPVRIKNIFTGISDQDWKTYTLRNGTKGAMERKVVIFDVYVWSVKGVNNTESAEKLRLIISTNTDGSEVKYSLTNEGAIKNRAHSDDEILYFQMQRYWVERGFQNCKDVLGMTDYQVRKWMAWHHHITLTMMALHVMLIHKIQNEETIPLLSCNDIKLFLALNLPQKAKTPEQVWKLILNRHRQRQADIDRYRT